MKIVLNHICHIPGAVGVPGQMVDVKDSKVAEELIRRGGAVRHEVKSEKAVKKVNKAETR